MSDFPGMEFGVHVFMTCDDTGLETCVKIDGAKSPPDAPIQQYDRLIAEAKSLMSKAGATNARPMTDEEIKDYKTEQ